MKYKKIHTMNQEQVVFNFLQLVTQLIDFHREVFHCSIGESIWKVPIDLMIDPNVGIAYFISKSSPATIIVKSFDMIEEINIINQSTANRSLEKHSMIDLNAESRNVHSSTKKILLNLKIKNENDVLVISCPSLSMAQSIADLIDGYHRVVTNNPETIWLNQKQLTTNNPLIGNENEKEQFSIKSNSSIIVEPKKAEFNLISPRRLSLDHQSHQILSSSSTSYHPLNQDDGDYSNPFETFTEIDRNDLKIEDCIGNGQFGDVYKGVFRKKSNNQIVQENVAIKISKRLNENGYSMFGRRNITLADQKLLCEAERMQKLNHDNIISLIGVCSSSPVYVVMELAEYGELRSFLLKNGSQLEQRRLIEYSYQISSALAYLEYRQFVHRDIASRNILVFSFDIVKLADFGLSRYIEDTSYYMATNSKLPIKWMAPESINFRRFTTASDVWMFGVCVWEIFMLGEKPFPGVKNSDVIGLIECGDRLSKPSRCSEQLYELLLKCWRYEPDRRPTFRVIKRKIYDVYQNELGLIGAIARIDLANDFDSLKSSLSSMSKDGSSSTSSSLSRFHLNKSIKSFDDNETKSIGSNLSLNRQSNAMDAIKIKEILEEQRRQMKEDQLWLHQQEYKSQKIPPHPSNRNNSDPENSGPNSLASVYEDADCDKNNETKNLLNIPRPNRNNRREGDESYSSFKSTKSSFENNTAPSSPSISSSSNHSNESTGHNIRNGNRSKNCNLSESLQKFFKHNRLANDKVRKEMMNKINCASAEIDRKEDPVYWSSINVINSVRYLLKGLGESIATEYIDLVKNVGLELRNLLANVDIFLQTIPIEKHQNVSQAQKKLSLDMNDLVESMKKAITYAETPIEGTYKQNMLESAYVLVIDSKNLMDLVDEIRLRMNSNTEDLS
ncbi:palmitoyltransferase ZDHHC15 [Sarcoptes scabiei]|nr:palmitoyltransferase ZDHHC15 [Sarcoptes scabiei]